MGVLNSERFFAKDVTNTPLSDRKGRKRRDGLHL